MHLQFHMITAALGWVLWPPPLPHRAVGLPAPTPTSGFPGSPRLGLRQVASSQLGTCPSRGQPLLPIPGLPGDCPQGQSVLDFQ